MKRLLITMAVMVALMATAVAKGPYVAYFQQTSETQHDLITFGTTGGYGDPKISLTGVTAIWVNIDMLGKSATAAHTSDDDSITIAFLSYIPGRDTLSDGTETVSGQGADRSYGRYDSVWVSPMIDADTTLYYTRYVTDIDSMYILGLIGGFGLRFDWYDGDSTAGGADIINSGDTNTINWRVSVELIE